MIKPLWLQSPETRGRLCSYCLKDAALSLALAMHKEFEMVLTTVEMCRCTRVRASLLLRAGSQEKVKSLILHQARDPHFDAENHPVYFPYDRPKTKAKDEKFKGASVLSPSRGARGRDQPVAVGDFASLYPSIMICHGVDYSTKLRVARGAAAPPDSPPHDTSPDVAVHYVHKSVRQGIIPLVLESLLFKRNQAKAMIKSCSDPGHKKMYDSRQLALKITANSIYGVVSNICEEMGESVTSWGRQMIHTAMGIAKAPPFNADVIYGDSVAADTPILYTYGSDCAMGWTPLGAFVTGWAPYYGDKECRTDLGSLKVWSDKGWTRVLKMIRHKTSKLMFRVVTQTGCVDVTEDHSLLLSDGKPTTPKDLIPGVSQLLHADLPVAHGWLENKRADQGAQFGLGWLLRASLEAKRVFIAGLSKREILHRSKMSAAKMMHLYRTLGIEAVVETPGFGLYNLVFGFRCNKDDTVKRVICLGRTDDYVYDLETENHHFSAGIGRLVVHNTDSLMMVFPKCTTVPDAFERLAGVCSAVTAQFPKPVSMAAEKVYDGFVLMGKKRYVGRCNMPPGPPKLDSKGVEKNRLDNCVLLRKMMARIFDMLFMEGDGRMEAVLKYVQDCVGDIIQGKVEISDLMITKGISKLTYKDMPAHLAVALRMHQRDPSYAVAPGERVPFVIVNSLAPKLCDKAEDPLWAIQHDMQIDTGHYIRDIGRPISRFLMWYLAPKPMLEAVNNMEKQISACTIPPLVAELNKQVKKTLDAMIDHVFHALFGQAAIARIPRPPPKRTGPMFRYLSKKSASASPRSPADLEKLEALRTQLLEGKAKCTRCRGREDDTVNCVQRDCSNLFRVAKLTKDIEEITS